MAVVDTKSAIITNRDATPPVANAAAIAAGNVRSWAATLELANGDSIGSTLRFGQVPSNARIHSIRVFCDAITSGAMDVGLYQTTANGSAVVDVDAYATAQSIASAITTGTEIMFEVRNIDKCANYVWQDGGLTADTGRFYDIVGTLTAATTAAGTVTLMVEYSTP
jgi:hypothetical protein